MTMIERTSKARKIHEIYDVSRKNLTHTIGLKNLSMKLCAEI